VPPAPPPPGFAETAREEGPIIKQDDQRRRYHDLLAGHAKEAGQNRKNEPAAAPCLFVRRSLGEGGPLSFRPFRSPDKAIEREQIEEAHEQLGAMHHRRHRLGLQGMDDPEQGDGEGEPRRVGADRSGEPAQRPPQDAKEGQGGQGMDGDAEGMVAGGIEAAEGVVDRQG
jgi:hypothetical protein